ncbi:hypothetical protein ACQPYK_28355 [Streptosporangium sp. CA-135522]|uniref:hypothetical protein n=1 Tax=Streptosporangium sp. CA-135522 TaxID=3240072 RepID=UPI003D8C16A3
MDRWDEEDEQRRIRSRPRTIGELFAVDRPLLRPLTDEPFETGADSYRLAQTRA